MSSPADMVEEAEAFLASPDTEDNAWIEDQFDAAGAENEPVMKSLADSMSKPLVRHGNTLKAVAFRMAVTESIIRRRKPERCCPHSQMVAPPPMIVDLGTGIMACKGCLPAMPDYFEDDGRCDLCDEPNTMFTPTWLQFGPALIHLDMCDECKDWSPAEEEGEVVHRA